MDDTEDWTICAGGMLDHPCHAPTQMTTDYCVGTGATGIERHVYVCPTCGYVTELEELVDEQGDWT